MSLQKSENSFNHLALDDFARLSSAATEISSVALGGRVLSVSDDFFAEAFHLLLVEPAPSLKGQYGPKGALFSGWESRRHNPTYDWCIIQLGISGFILGFDIDTSHFNGNEAPQASVQALFTTEAEDLLPEDERWVELLPKVDLGPNSRHLFTIPPTDKAYSHVKLNMYPDGGIARFRVYGLVSPIFPPLTESFDLASVYAGGRTVQVSDQHFGIGSNLVLPGRGRDMRDGWETRRSRVAGHRDWAIVKLGAPGFLEQLEIDTANFMGNFPESAEVHATSCPHDIPEVTEDAWVQILRRTRLGPHRRHYFQLENIDDTVFTHIRVTIHPDGGIKRVRVYGKRARANEDEITVAESVAAPEPTLSKPLTNGVDHGDKSPLVASVVGKTIPAVPLTPEGFAAFGNVVQAYNTPEAAPRGIKVTGANQGSAVKYHALAPVKQNYPVDTGAKTALSVYRASPIDATIGETFDVRLLERHPCTNQAFFPLGAGVDVSEYALERQGRAYLVITALNGSDDRPDLSTLRAFVASAAQGVVYDTAIWHHPLICLETIIDFACVETQIGGHPLDCEIVELDPTAGLPRVQIPKF
ncbi:Allantoicase [Serendipita sp. 396]|nr:Allantoicase [Serendipita sp. 396]KAG8773859.1 Allantoicase [Serendipita sp. 397]KAG8794125.1 Allantoicase [Serendipita sp. 398]KAG8862349.1 Allantoicase [Serendipita sp. 405]